MHALPQLAAPEGDSRTAAGAGGHALPGTLPAGAMSWVAASREETAAAEPAGPAEHSAKAGPHSPVGHTHTHTLERRPGNGTISRTLFRQKYENNRSFILLTLGPLFRASPLSRDHEGKGEVVLQWELAGRGEVGRPRRAGARP